MLYKTMHGRIIDEQELNAMSVLDIEEQGIHAADHWQSWREEN